MRADTRHEMAEVMDAVRCLDCLSVLDHLHERENHFRYHERWTHDNEEEVAELIRQVDRISRAREQLKAVQTRALCPAHSRLITGG